jgi:hypothetical protein
MGFFAIGFVGGFDDGGGGWFGFGLWWWFSSGGGFHMEGGRGVTSKLVKFQVRPDPLSK